MKSSQQVQDYWDERAKLDQEETSTTNDVYLRKIEQSVIIEYCSKMEKDSVLDIGCGDARTTAAVASRFPGSSIVGIDYAQHMITNALKLHSKVENLELIVADCTSDHVDMAHKSRYDIVYSTRCLINILEDQGRRAAIKFIHESLKPTGVFLMIENFMEGQNNFNRARVAAGLPKIPVRPHNRFFEEHELSDIISGLFEITDSINISSTYYLCSRIVYAKICNERGIDPDYNDDHHRYASMLPFAGDFGPVYLKVLRRIESDG